MVKGGKHQSFIDPNDAKDVSCLQNKYVVAIVGKAPNNIIFFVCKSNNINCLINESGTENSLGNSTNTLMTLT